MIKKINKLIDIFIKNEIINEINKIYFINLISEKLNIYVNTTELDEENDIAILFNQIGEFAETELKLNSEQIINEISGALLPHPDQIETKFKDIEKKDPQKAFEYLYKLSNDSYYIKYDRLKKNKIWNVETDFGSIDVTINLSKPEKSPIEIAKLMTEKSTEYPACVLCKENVGYSDINRGIHKQNLRIIKTQLKNDKFFFHYSPYGYYDHHLIVNKWEHTPMDINKNTFSYLLEFVEKYKFYSIGSNSDVPIVGGSLLSHSHFQGGKANFPIFNVDSLYEKELNEIKYEILNWPVSTIRISGNNIQKLTEIAWKISEKWYLYENENLNIKNKSGERNNAVTPYVRYNQGKYEVYIILRNNRVNEEHPLGIFHVHEDIWHIKKENIGLIEALGKAILPGRLLEEINLLINVWYEKKDLENTNIHYNWFENLRKIHKPKTKNEIENILFEEVGLVIAKGLKNCGVFKDKTTEFAKFLEECL